MTRPARHAYLGILTIVGLAAAYYAGEPVTAVNRLSLLTAWLCFGLLVAALSIGPLTALRTRRPVLNSLLRRDLGIWAGITGLLHVGFATVVVITPAYFRAYILPEGARLPGAAGWIGTASIVAGYVIGLIFLLLLSLSSNAALRRLGPERWKRYQRWAVGAFVLSAIHGLIFQVIEGRTGLWLIGLVLTAGALLGLRRRARRVVADGTQRMPVHSTDEPAG